MTTYAIESKLTTELTHLWKYETDEFKGTCLIANDEMQIKFRFECEGEEFYDVLEIDEVIDRMLRKPVSVEGIADDLARAFPGLMVTAMGRAASHGWITSRCGVSHDN